MRIRLDTSRDRLTVLDRLDGITAALHKYRVVEDRRRTRPDWGTHAEQSKYDGVVVRFDERTEYLDGYLVAMRPTPSPRVNRHLESEGVTVIDEVDDDGDAKVIA